MGKIHMRKYPDIPLKKWNVVRWMGPRGNYHDWGAVWAVNYYAALALAMKQETDNYNAFPSCGDVPLDIYEIDVYAAELPMPDTIGWVNNRMQKVA